MLKKIIIEKIEKEYTKPAFINNILELKTYCSNHNHRETLDYTICYYRALLFFDIDINHESDILRYQNIRAEVLEILNNIRVNNIELIRFIEFFKDLIDYGNKYTYNIRMLVG